MKRILIAISGGIAAYKVAVISEEEELEESKQFEIETLMNNKDIVEGLLIIRKHKKKGK